MTAEPDLLPLPAPDYLLPLGPGHGAISMWSENTIRQIVAHVTAAKNAEIEALRAEVATWEGLHASEVQVRQRWQARAERLAEALRHSRWCRTCAEDGWESCEDGSKNDALLRDQEEGHEQ